MLEIVGITYNVMAPVAEPLRFYGQRERMERIPKALFSTPKWTLGEQVDFMVVQESMVSNLHKILSSRMANHGFRYSTKPVSGSLYDLKFVSGGVAIFSRYPIVHEEFVIFDGICDQEDCLAAKGCIYARIRRNEHQYFNVMATHLQAWETPKSRIVRHGQIKRIRRFIDQLHIPSSEPLIIMGDLNVDYYSQQEQLQNYLDVLSSQVVELRAGSPAFSCDPSRNQLFGVDGGLAYSSDAFPGGCYDEYLKTLYCPCCPRELLDYALVSHDHLAFDRNLSWSHVIPLKDAQPYDINITMTIRRTIRDLSDHFPLMAKFVFWPPEPDPHISLRPDRILPGYEKLQSIIWLENVEESLFTLAYTGLFIVFLVAIIYLINKWL